LTRSKREGEIFLCYFMMKGTGRRMSSFASSATPLNQEKRKGEKETLFQERERRKKTTKDSFGRGKTSATYGTHSLPILPALPKKRGKAG